MAKEEEKKEAITKTFKELTEVDSIIATMYGENEKLQVSKFGYAYKRFADKNYFPVLKEYQGKIQDARIDHAMEHAETKEILTDDKNPRGYKYTKIGLKNVIKEENRLQKEWNEKEIEITPFFCNPENLPELSEEQREQLKGILIK